ncbi:MAG: hypothetical protein ACOZNI_03215 [Myxococcota bacterium]
MDLSPGVYLVDASGPHALATNVALVEGVPDELPAALPRVTKDTRLLVVGLTLPLHPVVPSGTWLALGPALAPDGEVVAHEYPAGRYALVWKERAFLVQLD